MPRQLPKALKLWQQASKEYRDSKKAEGNKMVLLPKKGTCEYNKIKKRYDELMAKEGSK